MGLLSGSLSLGAGVAEKSRAKVNVGSRLRPLRADDNRLNDLTERYISSVPFDLSWQFVRFVLVTRRSGHQMHTNSMLETNLQQPLFAGIVINFNGGSFDTDARNSYYYQSLF